MQYKSLQTVQALLLATSAALALFLWQGHLDFSLLDEGFLWYGVQRVMLGEVPVRDFMAYDPGRYYWSATLMSLWGVNGIIALRGAAAVFQAGGLFIGLALLARSSPKSNLPFLLLAATTLAGWMLPWFRQFDISLSIALIGALTFLIQRPSGRRYFLTGLFVGLAAVFGRNHGIYGVVGSLGAMAYLAIRSEDEPGLLKAFPLWVAGVAVGYLPILLMVVTIPGFASAFWESIHFLFEFKATNLPLPVPWPWRFSSSQWPLIEIGLFFIATVIFGVAGIFWVIRQKLQKKPASPVFVATVFLALPYAHYAYSRADLQHLALGISPFLLGAFAILADRKAYVKWPLALILCGASASLMWPLQPGWQFLNCRQCVEINLAGDKLKIDPYTARDLVMLNKLVKDYAPAGRSFITAPFWPGAYAAFGRKSPMWEIYALFPRSVSFQQAEIERIKAADPGFVVVLDSPLDGRDELRFKNTHPMVDRYLRENFKSLTGYSQNPAYQIYGSK